METRDPQLTKLGPGVRRDGRMVGVSFAIDDGPSFYLPFGHAGGGNLEPDKVLMYLKDQARDYNGIIVGANLGYDLDYLAEYGVEFWGTTFRDVQVAEPLIDENQFSYSLDAIAKRHGLVGKDETQLRAAAEAFRLDPKKDLWQLHSRHVGAYAEGDVTLPLALLRRQERILEDQNLWDVYNMESDVLPILLKMRRRGVKIDFDKLEQVEKYTEQQEAASLADVRTITGVSIAVGDVWKPKLLAEALSSIGIECPKTPKTGAPSVKTELLEAHDHRVTKALLRARAMNKVRTTFASSVRRHETNGRIHCTFNQLKAQRDDGDVFGTIARLSSSAPNLQQQPARDPELGPLWRSVYIPDDGGMWCSADFSQQEPRWLIHYAELINAPGAKTAADCYRNDPTTDNHTMMAEMSGRPRKEAKTIFLGLCYGMGGGKLCKNLDLPTEIIVSKRTGESIEVAGPEGQALFAQFHKSVPFLSYLRDACERRAEMMGYLVTAGGRRCRFPKGPNGEAMGIHKAVNKLVQGSSADHTKRALIQADRAGLSPQLQVHDELCRTMDSEAQAREFGEIMRTSMACNVPHKVDVEVGPNWGEIQELH